MNFDEYENINRLLQLNKTDADIIKALTDLADPIDEIFGKCRYGSRKPSDCRELFSKVITSEGVCWTFNMLDEKDLFYETMHPSLRLPHHGRESNWFLEKGYRSNQVHVYPQRAIGSGLPSGLTVDFRVKKSNFNPDSKEGGQAFRFSLHSPVKVAPVSKQFYSVSVGKQTTISIMPFMIYSSKDIKDYEPVNRQCFFSDEKKLKFFKIYSKTSCELECLADYTLSTCGCVKFSMPRDNETKVCNHLQLECIEESETNFTLRELKLQLLKKEIKQNKKLGKATKHNEDLEKICKCLPSCTSIRYDAEILQTDFNMQSDEE